MTRVIYLHGFASSPSSRKARYFRQVLEARGLQVEVPDLACGDFEHLTVTGQLARIEDLADRQPVSLVGSSLGGYLAALYAARHPEVARVVLLAPAFRFAKRWAEYLGPTQLDDWRRNGNMEVFHYGDGRNRSLGYQLLEDARKYEDLPDFQQPTLIFHGLHDEVVPVHGSQEFTHGHPNAQLQILDSGHELLNVLDQMGPRTAEFLLGEP